MPAISLARVCLFIALAALMAVTRVNHFGVLPDASWAVFFAGGFYLARQWRWAFPALMALAVGIDVAVIGLGQDFWSHYCVSPGYWFLLPAHFAMWAGGSWLASRAPKAQLLQFAPVLLLAVLACHGFAQGGFYWLSSSVAEPSVAGWMQNYLDWLPAYLRTAVTYVGSIAVLHAVAVLLGWAPRDQRETAR